MGVWGTAIFSDETASDVRNEFKDHIGDGLTSEEATAALLKAYADDLNDPDTGPPFWLGLALTQWNLGRLLPEVRDEAMRIMDAGVDLARWEDDPTQQVKRAKVLAALREKLNSTPPPAKKIPRRFRDSNDWPVGAVVAYRQSDGKLWLFRVLGHHQDVGGRSPVVDVLDWSGNEIPSHWTMRWLKPRIATNGRKHLILGAVSSEEYPSDRVTLTGAIIKPWRKELLGGTVMLWRNLDKDLTAFFSNDGT